MKRRGRGMKRKKKLRLRLLRLLMLVTGVVLSGGTYAGGWIPKNIFITTTIILAIVATVGVAFYGLWTNYRDRIPDLHFPPITLKSKLSPTSASPAPLPSPQVTENQPVASTTEKTNLKGRSDVDTQNE